MVTQYGRYRFEFEVVEYTDEDIQDIDCLLTYVPGNLRIYSNDILMVDFSCIPLGELAEQAYRWVKETEFSLQDFRCFSIEDYGHFFLVEKIDVTWYLSSEYANLKAAHVNIDQFRKALWEYVKGYRQHIFDVFKLDVLQAFNATGETERLRFVEQLPEFS